MVKFKGADGRKIMKKGQLPETNQKTLKILGFLEDGFWGQKGCFGGWISGSKKVFKKDDKKGLKMLKNKA